MGEFKQKQIKRFRKKYNIRKNIRDKEVESLIKLKRKLH